MDVIKKVELDDEYIIPCGTKLWLINLQQHFITTKDYVIKVTNTLVNNDTCFFGELYEIVGHASLHPHLRKVLHGVTLSNLSIVKPIGNALEPNYFSARYGKP